MEITIKNIKRIFKEKGYRFFDNGDYNLNIIGIRSDESQSNQFDDYIVVIYKESGKEKIEIFPATTDPGKPWLLNPMDKNGTAVIVPGQYLGAYTIGIHGRSHASGGYKALEQVKPMTYVRDNNKDSVINFELYNDKSKQFSANLKTNIHRASKWSIVRLVETYSAGCQVIQDPKDFDKLMALADKSAKKYGNSFTYTLLLQKYF